MNEFIRREKEVPRIPAILISQVTGFVDAPEYGSLRQYELNIPGVVCGAFAQYICRLFVAQGATGKDQLKSALDVLEELSMSSDPEVVNLVVTEVLENFNLSREQMTALNLISGQKTRALIDKWILATES